MLCDPGWGKHRICGTGARHNGVCRGADSVGRGGNSRTRQRTEAEREAGEGTEAGGQ